MEARTARALPAILMAGAIAGAMDLAAASFQSLVRLRPPLRMLQFIASGWLGSGSFTLGWWSGALGFASHFLIATIWASIFWAASRAVPALVRHAWWSGAAYGLVVYTMMYEVVMPLSAIQRTLKRGPDDLILGLVIHITCVGWPIALSIRANTPRSETSLT